MEQKQLKYTLPWLLYIITLITYVCFNLLKYSYFGLDEKLISAGCVISIAVVIFLSLSTIVSKKAALTYILYWIGVSMFVEYIYISTGRFSHDEGAQTIFGVVPILIGLNWLIIFFSVYALSVFCSFSLKNTYSKVQKLFLVLSLDGFIIILYAFLYEPIGQSAGYYTWNTYEYQFLVFNLIPISTFLEYLFGVQVIMLPIRYWEVYRNPPKQIAYQKKYSFPLYFSWSFFAALTYWAFRKDIPDVGTFGLVILLLLSTFILYKRRYN